jgi:hypothetical protein
MLDAIKGGEFIIWATIHFSPLDLLNAVSSMDIDPSQSL